MILDQHNPPHYKIEVWNFKIPCKMENSCYLCLDGETQYNSFANAPCNCKGSIHVHQTCLETMCKNNYITECPICKVCYKLSFTQFQVITHLFKKYWPLVDKYILCIIVIVYVLKKIIHINFVFTYYTILLLCIRHMCHVLYKNLL